MSILFNGSDLRLSVVFESYYAICIHHLFPESLYPIIRPTFQVLTFH
jgi:hypothetical protein